MSTNQLPSASRTVSSVWVKGVADALALKGLDVPALLQEARIDADALDDPDARFPTQSVCRLWEVAVQRSGNPAIGVCEPGFVQPGMYDVVAYAMMSSEHLLAGLQRLARFIPIVTNASQMGIEEVPEGYWLSLHISGGDLDVPRQRYDFNVSSFMNFCRWITKQDIRPLAVEIAYPEPDDVQPYREVYRCPIRFGMPENRMLFARNVMVLPPQMSNSLLTELHDRCALDRLRRLSSERISTRTRELIIARLPHGDPLRAEIASELCMSGRTLQRRLEEEGTSFQQLVDDTRCELAKHYLRQQRLSLAETAHLLGFSDQSAFFRACRRWFDMSPRQFRDQQGSPKSSFADSRLRADHRVASESRDSLASA